ncbi:MAG: 4Fe-4S dicluster domain-containing protein, partial [Treponemataceae bacterium]|nr:4Fe-4S dicluster domain-containing protein [Treponemataceae bacterium]
CIRCGRCSEGCPMFLIPSYLAKLSEFKAFEEAEENRVMDCMECGTCSYVCPAGIQITQLIKLAKGEVLRRRKKGGEKK